MNIELSEYYKDKTVLITGGLGFIGSNLSRRLISLGADVVIIDDITTGYATNLKGYVLGKDYMFYEASVTSRNWVNELVLHADIIFHLAARNIIASTENPQDDFETNIGGTLNILLALKEFPFKRMVYTSSTSVYGNPRYLPINEDDNINLLTPYAVSKYSAEGYCMAFHENYGVETAVLRLSNVYGRYQRIGVVPRFMRSAIEGKPLEIHGDGYSTRDFTYVDDVVEALLIAGQHPAAIGEVFNVATGIETSVNYLADRCLELNVDKYPMLSDEEYVQYIDRRDIDNIRRRVLNIEKIRRKLGWMPKVNLEDGLRMTRDWMLEAK